MPALGLLTIGQSPRADGLAREVQACAGPGITAIERGALDGLTPADVAALAPREDDYHLITLLRDGTAVQVRKAAILDRLQAQLTALETEHGVAATLLVCTGAFPPFRHAKPLLQPQAALYGAVLGLAGGGRIGALLPLAAQREQARAKWREFGVADPVLAEASPYGADPCAAVASAAGAAREAGATILFLDCFGYDLAMRDAARAAFGGPVVLARSLAARLAAELID